MAGMNDNELAILWCAINSLSDGEIETVDISRAIEDRVGASNVLSKWRELGDKPGGVKDALMSLARKASKKGK